MTAGKPRVLHAPVEVAGQAALSAYGLREIGVDSAAFARRHPFDYSVEPDVIPGPSLAAWARATIATAPRYDVVHYYFGRSFLPESLRGLDARALRLARRRVVVEFMGSEIRLPSVEARRNPYFVEVLEDEDAAIAQMRRWSSITDGHAIVCDRALSLFAQLYFEHVHVVPFRVDTRAFEPAPPSPTPSRAPVVVHAPSSRAGKGTKHVRAAVEALQTGGAELDYVEVHGASQAETAAACRRADIVVDQVCSGSHGVFAAEAMSMAKPVLCHLLPEVAETYPDGFPVIDANPDTLTDVLGDWLERPQDRHDVGIASRSYAERVHDIRVVAQRLLDVYGQLPRRR